MRLEVIRAYEDYRSSHAAMDSAQTGVEAAEESYRVRLAQLEAGVSVSSDLLDAQNDLTRARIEIVNAAIDLRIARAQLLRALGR